MLDNLSKDARAWADEVLKAHPELTESGRVLVVEAARCRDAIARADEALQKDGYYVEGRYGTKPNPAEAVARQNRAQLLRLLIALDLAEAD